ncbi:MAG TPA: hypothetical protein VMD59_13900 [Acidimicrobiales bacterium]|nr:hypothetical protein [Acidimicrobiales bacterium]
MPLVADKQPSPERDRTGDSARRHPPLMAEALIALPATGQGAPSPAAWSKPGLLARALPEMQGLCGNRAAARLAASSTVRVQRKPTDQHLQALGAAMAAPQVAGAADLMDKLTFLQNVTVGYLSLPATDQDGEEGLDVLSAITTSAREAEAKLIALRAAAADTTSNSGFGVAKAACITLAREAGNHLASIKMRLKGERYTQQVEPATLAALGERRAKYLMITPRPGTREAEATGGSGYPESLPPEQSHTLALPETSRQHGAFSRIAVQGQAAPNVLDVLAVAGNHGGVEALFEQTGAHGLAFSKTYWRDSVVAPLVQKGVQARMIVLDACLTASMVDIFVPLCAPGGKIICSMYSINAKLMTPQVWEQITGADAPRAPAVVTEAAQQMAGRAAELTAEGLADTIRMGSPEDVEALLRQEPTIADLISQMRYLPRIVSALADAAANAAGRARHVDDLLAITQQRPEPGEAEVLLAARVASALGANDPTALASAQAILEEHLAGLLGVRDKQLAELSGLLRPRLTERLQASEAARAPSHLAVYDQATNTLRYDRVYDEPTAPKRIGHSTGTESEREVRQLRGVLNRMVGTMHKQAVSASQLFA